MEQDEFDIFFTCLDSKPMYSFTMQTDMMCATMTVDIGLPFNPFNDSVF